jgi:hypothetical protein
VTGVATALRPILSLLTIILPVTDVVTALRQILSLITIILAVTGVATALRQILSLFTCVLAVTGMAMALRPILSLFTSILATGQLLHEFRVELWQTEVSGCMDLLAIMHMQCHTWSLLTCLPGSSAASV